MPTVRCKDILGDRGYQTPNAAMSSLLKPVKLYDNCQQMRIAEEPICTYVNLRRM